METCGDHKAVYCTIPTRRVLSICDMKMCLTLLSFGGHYSLREPSRPMAARLLLLRWNPKKVVTGARKGGRQMV